MNKTASKEERGIQFVCNYDRCNSHDNFVQLKSLVDQYYDITPFQQMFFNNQSFQTVQMPTMYSKSTESTTTTTNSSSFSSAYSTNINQVKRLTFILIFFCVVLNDEGKTLNK